MDQQPSDAQGHDAAPEQPGSRPAVSAVIPAYNAAETIERALDSVYAQTYDNIIEVIVVDDGSEDDTAEIVREKYPDVTLTQQENAGNAGARNTGVAAATGEYIAFLDADDEWLPEKTEVQVGVMERHPGLTLLTTAATVAGQEQSPSEDRANAGDTPRLALFTFRDYLHRKLSREVQFCCTGWLIQACVIRDQGFDASLRRAVDWEFLLRLTGQGYSVGAVLEPLYRYHVLPDSVSNCEDGRREICEIDIELVKRYNPSGNGWQSELLTPTEFRELMHFMYASRGWQVWELGDHELARRHLAEARNVAPAGLVSSLRHRLALTCPWLYWYGRAAFFRMRALCTRSIK